MLDFMEEAYPYSTRMDDEDKETICGKVCEKRMLTSDGSVAVMDLLHMEMAGHMNMEWAGTLKELQTGTHRYAIYLRARFRTDNMDDFGCDIRQDIPLELLEQHGAPLETTERSDSMDYIAGWGA